MMGWCQNCLISNYCDTVAEFDADCVVTETTALALPLISVKPVLLVLSDVVFPPVETLDVMVVLVVELFVCVTVVVLLFETLTVLFDPAPLPLILILTVGVGGHGVAVGVGILVGVGVGVMETTTKVK